MEFIIWFWQIILHLDQHLAYFAHTYGAWIYAILFLIIFCETGLVVTPFLPGDSLLFVAGAVAAAGSMNIHALAFTLFAAAFLGNLANYQIGRFLGPRMFNGKRDSRLFKREYLDRTHAFYQKHGGKTLILSRFVPIIRTYAPFVAGIGQMAPSRFLLYNLVGGLAWVIALLYAGYWFGNLPWVKNNLSLVIFAIIGVSLLPVVAGYARSRTTAA